MSKDLKKDQLKGVLASLASMEKTNVNIDTLKLISAKKFDRNQFDKKVRPPKPEDPAILVEESEEEVVQQPYNPHEEFEQT